MEYPRGRVAVPTQKTGPGVITPKTDVDEPAEATPFTPQPVDSWVDDLSLDLTDSARPRPIEGSAPVVVDDE